MWDNKRKSHNSKSLYVIFKFVLTLTLPIDKALGGS